MCVLDWPVLKKLGWRSITGRTGCNLDAARSPLLLPDAAARRPWLTRDGEGERVREGRKHRSKFEKM